MVGQATPHKRSQMISPVLRAPLFAAYFLSICALLHADTLDLVLSCFCAVLCCATPAVPKDMQLARRIRGPIAGVASF